MLDSVTKWEWDQTNLHKTNKCLEKSIHILRWPSIDPGLSVCVMHMYVLGHWEGWRFSESVCCRMVICMYVKTNYRIQIISVCLSVYLSRLSINRIELSALYTDGVLSPKNDIAIQLKCVLKYVSRGNAFCNWFMFFCNVSQEHL